MGSFEATDRTRSIPGLRIPIYWDRPHDPLKPMEWITITEMDDRGSMPVYLQVLPILKTHGLWDEAADLWSMLVAMSDFVTLHTDSFLVDKVHQM